MTSLQDMVRVRQGVLSLVLFRDVLDDSVGRAWTTLVRLLLRANIAENTAVNADEIDAILIAYGEWMGALADRNMGWQEHLRDRILSADNQFARRSEERRVGKEC